LSPGPDAEFTTVKLTLPFGLQQKTFPPGYSESQGAMGKVATSIISYYERA
jgi:hypothetical protein